MNLAFKYNILVWEQLSGASSCFTHLEISCTSIHLTMLMNYHFSFYKIDDL